ENKHTFTHRPVATHIGIGFLLLLGQFRFTHFGPALGIAYQSLPSFQILPVKQSRKSLRRLIHATALLRTHAIIRIIHIQIPDPDVTESHLVAVPQESNMTAFSKQARMVLAIHRFGLSGLL